MPQPPAYTRKTNFAEFQASSPTTPLTGSRVDEELNAVKITLDAILANLELIQRDDGEVANLTIGVEQLKTQLVVGLDPPVEWQPSTTYVANNTVIYIDFDASRSEVWLVDTAHTSTSDFDADAAAFMTQIAQFSISTVSAANIGFAPGASGLASNVQQALLDVNDKVVVLENKVGDTQHFSTFAEITVATALESGVTTVTTDGYNAIGDGGAAMYKVVSTLPVHQYDRFYKQVANGQFLDFVAPKDGGSVTEKHAGGIGDGVADDWDPVQQTLLWANHPDRSNSAVQSLDVRLIGPIIQFTRPLLVTTGKFFTGVVNIYGPRPKDRGDVNFGGVVLRPTFANGPPLVVHGVRNLVIDGLAFASVTTGADARDYKTALNFDLLKIIDEAEWDAVGVGTQHAPECFIAVDPFVGAAPADTYALSPTFPSWDTGALYGRLQSSRVTFRNCSFENREVAVTVQSGDSNSNGDFMRFEHCRFTAIKYAQSLGNSQARSGEFENCEFNTMLYGAVTGVHGRQAGRLDMHFLNCSGALMKGMFKTHDTATGSLNTVIERCYIESGWHWCDIGTDGLFPSTVEIRNSTLNVVNGKDSAPGPVIRGSSAALVTVKNTLIGGGVPSCVDFQPQNVVCDGVYVSNSLIASTGLVEKEYQRIGISASCGIYPNMANTKPFMEDWLVRAIVFDEDTDDLNTSSAWTDPRKNPFTTRDTLMPLHQGRYTPRSQPNGEILTRRHPSPQSFISVVGTPGAAQCQVSISDRTMTLTMGSNFTDASSFVQGGRPGDAIRSSLSKTIWWIRSRTGTTVIAEQQTNYTPDGSGGYTHIDDVIDPNGDLLTQNQGAWADATVYAAGDTVQSQTDGRWYQTALGGTSSGTDADLDGGSDTGVTDWTQVQAEEALFFINQRQYVPSRLFYADFSTGSGNIDYYQGRKNAADDGLLNNASTGMQAGDYIFIDAEQDGMHIGTEAEITDINTTPGVMTVSGGAARVARTGFVLTGIRQPPANEASR